MPETGIISHIHKRKIATLSNPLYLNANLIYSEALNYLRKDHWQREIKTGTLQKLREKGYHLVTSLLTRMEVIQRLHFEENINPEKSREMYNIVLNDFHIMEISGIDNLITLNDPLIDQVGTLNLKFQDALHLLLAKRLDIPLCTHDKKILKNFSQHPQKVKFYHRVYKPEDVLSSPEKV